MTRTCGECVVRLVIYCVNPCAYGRTDSHKMKLLSYLPSITQSPCEVPINSSIGNDSHAFVRDAMNA